MGLWVCIIYQASSWIFLFVLCQTAKQYGFASFFILQYLRQGKFHLDELADVSPFLRLASLEEKMKSKMIVHSFTMRSIFDCVSSA